MIFETTNQTNSTNGFLLKGERRQCHLEGGLPTEGSGLSPHTPSNPYEG
jgi:hypothetical protein